MSWTGVSDSRVVRVRSGTPGSLSNSPDLRRVPTESGWPYGFDIITIIITTTTTATTTPNTTTTNQVAVTCYLYTITVYEVVNTVVY
jgi:hypothetical protein